jgi:hypothetical protein
MSEELEGSVTDYAAMLRDWATAIEGEPVGLDDLTRQLAPVDLRACADEIERLNQQVGFGIENVLTLGRALREQAAVHNERKRAITRHTEAHARLLAHVKALAAENDRLRAPSLPVAADPKNEEQP